MVILTNDLSKKLEDAVYEWRKNGCVKPIYEANYLTNTNGIENKWFSKSEIYYLENIKYLKFIKQEDNGAMVNLVFEPTHIADCYEEFKKEHDKKNKEEWIKCWLPITLSTATLASSTLIDILNLLITL